MYLFNRLNLLRANIKCLIACYNSTPMNSSYNSSNSSASKNFVYLNQWVYIKFSPQFKSNFFPPKKERFFQSMPLYSYNFTII